ncbi:MAG TPA: LytTR family DNA-binding domain-containing protein [Ignavibacteriaceae bacterium]|nr:LytTR family DNA-binding domain-containing protein [Ignavibacteriaceae bacterium]
MKAIIIEDEKLAAERLENLITEIDSTIRIEAILPSVKEAVGWLATNNPDLIFLDIQLADGLSFSIFEKVEVRAPIIFTTAYDQYAIKAFKHNSVDYLLKPVRKNELQAAIEKMKRLSVPKIFDFESLLKTYIGKEVDYKKRFLIQYGQKIKKIETEEIAFFFALEKNVFLTTYQNNTYPVDFSLDKLMEILDPENFFRINRKIIISFNSIKSMTPFSRSRIKIELNPTPPKDVESLVSIERSAAFKKWLDK